jgi:hypothetical protein
MSSMKTVVAAVAVLGSVSFAQASSFDPNLANRYPSYAESGVYGYSSAGGAPRRLNPQSLQSRNVSLPRQSPPSANEELWMDRASESFSGGGY